MIVQVSQTPSAPATTDREDQARQLSTSAMRPSMVRAELLGSHAHECTDGTRINIWQRGPVYLARGYYNKSRFGETLGDDRKRAQSRLIEIVCEVGQGTYTLPSKRGERPLAQACLGRLTVRQLCDEFLLEKRQIRGDRTAKDYRTRLAPLIEFSELDQSRKRWPTASDVNREFSIAFQGFVSGREVTRNGLPSSPKKPISPHQRFNVLDCARTLFNWARKPQIGKLPSTFVNPFDSDIVGQRPKKDPLRLPVFPQERRLALVVKMDDWQLPHLALSLVLPLRPEDCAGLLVGDMDFERRFLHFGTRLGGRDFGKGHQSFTLPVPAALIPFLRFCIGGRTDGSLLQRRTVFEGRRMPVREVAAGRDAAGHIDEAFRRASPRDLKSPQDQKRLVRRTIREMGGVSERELAREFGAVLTKAGLDRLGRFYDLRGSISTEMERAGVSHLVQRYVTGHTTSDILNVYVSLDPFAEMQKYFTTIQPLLDAMLDRARQLGLKLPE